jgi:hypothetical protein
MSIPDQAKHPGGEPAVERKETLFKLQKRWVTGLAVVTGLVMMFAGTALAGTIVTYTGQGFNFDGTTHNLNDERCGLTGQNDANDGGTGQFANWNGPGQPYEAGQGYLVWVLTANGATSAKLNLPDDTVDMIKVGGTFKYASKYYNHEAIANIVTADYEGKAKGNVQLVVSHGCQPFETEGAWCSPGYWRNAADAAWALTGYAKTDLFNDTVVPSFYDTPFAADPTLNTVLTNPQTYSGAPSGPLGLNAFNATGAFLTDQIPGFHFDPALVGNETACPIDNHGNFKA